MGQMDRRGHGIRTYGLTEQRPNAMKCPSSVGNYAVQGSTRRDVNAERGGREPRTEATEDMG